MMTEDDRRKIFWLLKKYSSYTAWKTLGDAFHEFTDAWEYAVKKAKPEDQDEFIVGAFKDFLDGCRGFDDGLPQLKRGERHVFRRRTGGDLGWHASYAVSYAEDIMNPREYVFDWMVNKDKVQNSIAKVSQLRKGSSAVVELSDPTSPAANREYMFDSLFEPFNFPPNLGDVPTPTETTIDSGKEVPLDGIWEPEWRDPSKKQNRVVGIRSLFTPVEPSDLQKGCMNYLIAGTIAPPYQDSSRDPVMPVRWRLIWQDTRYRDGTIPDEEADYLAPTSAMPSHHAEEGALRVKAGQPCPRAGTWESLDAKGVKRTYKEGDIMADLGSAYGFTLWQFIE